MCTQAISAINYLQAWPSAAESLPFNTKLLKHGHGLQTVKLTYTFVDLGVFIFVFLMPLKVKNDPKNIHVVFSAWK